MIVNRFQMVTFLAVDLASISAIFSLTSSFAALSSILASSSSLALVSGANLSRVSLIYLPPFLAFLRLVKSVISLISLIKSLSFGCNWCIRPNLLSILFKVSTCDSIFFKWVSISGISYFQHFGLGSQSLDDLIV